jgi:hypothetical protein
VEVDGLRARDPQSYLALYRLPSPRTPIADPVHAVLTDKDYVREVRRYWIPVNLWSRRPSPWGDGGNYVWVGRHADVLKRDDEILRIPYALAKRIRSAASLR